MAMIPSERWEAYVEHLDPAEKRDEMWLARLKRAFLHGVEDGYNLGYEDGRDLAWGLTQEKDVEVTPRGVVTKRSRS